MSPSPLSPEVRKKERIKNTQHCRSAGVRRGHPCIYHCSTLPGNVTRFLKRAQQIHGVVLDARRHEYAECPGAANGSRTTAEQKLRLPLLPLYIPAVCIYLSVEPSNTIAEHLTTTEAQNQPKAHENDVSSKTRRLASYSNSKTVKSDQIRSKKRTNTPLCRPPLRRDPREG